jgi:hypothetical protein
MPIATLALAATSFANLAANADFSAWESPNQPTGWTLEDTTRTRVERSSNQARSAPYSARETRMIDSLGNNKGLSQYVAVSPNAQYTLAVWCFDDDPLVRGGISINWRKADTTSYISNSGVAYSDSGLTGWQKITKSDSSPAEAALAEVLLRVYNLSGGTPAGGKVCFDDVEFDTGMEAIEERPGRAVTTAELELRPNPTTGRATISFELARAAHVGLNLYDLTGSSVAELYAGVLGAGRHRFPFAGRDREGALLPAGPYFLVLTDGGNQSTIRKVVFEPWPTGSR